VHVVITGASSGIGEALAREYLKRGASLTLVARRKGKLDELAAGHAGTSMPPSPRSARSTCW
jgi:short-subunit dehydrogenase